MKKLVIIGSNGQLGHDLIKTVPKHEYHISALSHTDIEISDQSNIDRVLSIIAPDIIISTAAYHKLENVEKFPEKAYAVNTIGASNLAKFCKKNKSTLVFISTDYVFGAQAQRTTPYTEQDNPGPVNTYGITKIAAEYAISATLKNHFIIRSSGLFGTKGSSGKGGNFIDSMIAKAKSGEAIKVVNDQISSPTYTINLAEQIYEILRHNKFGTYHCVSKGECSWYEFALTIFSLLDLHPSIAPVSSLEFDSTVIRPNYSALKNARLQKYHIEKMMRWEDSIKAYLKAKNYL